MTLYQFHFGRSFIQFTIPEKFAVKVITPKNIKPVQAQELIIHEALIHPLNDLDLHKIIRSESTVIIVINDKTRPVPNSLLIPELLTHLKHLGVKDQHIQFLIGVGTHTPMPPEEYQKILPENIVHNYKVISHDCDDENNLVYKGITSCGTPVYVNRIFDQADVRIVVGNIEPHHFAGFSGGAKGAAIGVCGRKTITTNHQFLLDPAASTGNYFKNPLRQDIEEIGRLIKLDLALNVVMNAEKEILNCFWGKPEEVIIEGMKISKQIAMQPLNHPGDLVIASAGGYPKDINLYQSQKAMTHASLAVRPGAPILLAAACEEGVGSDGYEKFMTSICSFGEVMQKFSDQGFSVGPHKAVQIARIAKDHPIYLYSTLNPVKVGELLLNPIKTIDEGIQQALKIRPDIHSIILMPYAVSTIPNIQEG